MVMKLKKISRTALEKAADALLGESYKLKPQRSVRVDNPDYRATPVNWKMKMLGPEQGTLSIHMGGKADMTLSVPCEIRKGFLAPRKFQITKIITEGDMTIKKSFSVLPKEGKKMDPLSLIINGIIDAVSKVASQVLLTLKPNESIPEQTTLVRPSVFRIPKKITVRKVNIEELQEVGQLPEDLTGFKVM